MRVFVDVGAHYGETLDVALDPRWAFERIHVLEPSHDCQAVLSRFRDRRLVLDDIGLSNGDREADLFGSGSLGASIYSDKPHGENTAVETIRLRSAAAWLTEHTDPTDEVWLKLNCEGSEADILDDLLGAPAVFDRIRGVYVDFDIRKIPSQAHRQAAIEEGLRESGVDYVTPELVGAAGNAGVERWLKRTCPPVAASPAARLRHRLRLYLPPYLMVKNTARRLLPRSAFLWVGARFGRVSRRAG